MSYKFRYNTLMENSIFNGNIVKNAPLAERMRPTTLDEFLGQGKVVGNNSLLKRCIEANRLGSCIFYGPPGTGKTTLAGIIANTLNSNFVKLNAVTCGVADAKKVIDDAKKSVQLYGRKTYLFLDECHRWNKAQSDLLLEAIEKGIIIFIGSTTENPFVSMTRAIVSRCKIFKFEPLGKDDIKKAILRAKDDKIRGFGEININLTDEALEHFILSSGGDVRSALTSFEIAVLSTKPDKGIINVTEEVAKESTQDKPLALDKDLHYDMLSAFCKSVRGSDVNAALYWSTRLVESGCDPLIIARRLIAHSSEDVGMANSNALQMSVSAYTALEKMGVPEGLIPLSHAIIYVTLCPKSNSVISAMQKAQEDVRNTFNDAVPDHLKNTNYLNEKRAKYKYPHNYEGGYVKQQYLPDEISDHIYYIPSKYGSEDKIRESMQKTDKKD